MAIQIIGIKCIIVSVILSLNEGSSPTEELERRPCGYSSVLVLSTRILVLPLPVAGEPGAIHRVARSRVFAGNAGTLS